MKLQNKYLSFFSSGFPSHVKVKAIDIGEEGNIFHSPFKGEIISITKFKLGRPNKFAKTDYDVQIFLNTGKRKIKILHVNPYKQEGEYIKEGEALGEFISSPYTGGDFPHAHIEGVRLIFPKITKYEEKAIGKVIRKTPYYLDVELKTYAEAGNFRGLGCCGGIINASFPYAGYGGIIGLKLKEEKLNIVNQKYLVYRTKRKNLTMFEMKKGLIKNWEYESSFKVMRNEPVGGLPIFESILSYNGHPLVRIFNYKKDIHEEEEVDVWDLIKKRVIS
ncbi:hypothetical protein [Acidianus manzaensis]|uniref:DUF8155 domain-containing protein n=1 Tax=Acidianus manzaensis TaxID=282676 RepID=A0A1W6K2V4_9CREN|nr:hypothetical protein [Acidianus manzaensis]ARM76782.1 hypothetical protein B6F84_12655 [Acidianus manzaensis]